MVESLQIIIEWFSVNFHIYTAIENLRPHCGFDRQFFFSGYENTSIENNNKTLSLHSIWLICFEFVYVSHFLFLKCGFFYTLFRFHGLFFAFCKQSNYLDISHQLPWLFTFQYVADACMKCTKPQLAAFQSIATAWSIMISCVRAHNIISMSLQFNIVWLTSTIEKIHDTHTQTFTH